MRLLLVLALALQSRAAASFGSSPGTVDQIVAGLAQVCSDGVREAVQLEVRDANNQSVRQLRSGQQELGAALRQLRQQLTSLQLAPEECPPGWSRHRDSCYFVPLRRRAGLRRTTRARRWTAAPDSPLYTQSRRRSSKTSARLSM